MTDQPNRRPDNLARGPDPGQSDLVDQLIDRLFPVIEAVLRRLAPAEPGGSPDQELTFTTSQLIDVMQSDPKAAAAYQEAIDAWGEGERYSKMVVHGQVIPGALRHSRLVEWAGYAHGEPDDYAVPAWWKLRVKDEDLTSK